MLWALGRATTPHAERAARPTHALHSASRWRSYSQLTFFNFFVRPSIKYLVMLLGSCTSRSNVKMDFFENIFVITPPENSCDSRAPLGLPRSRCGATSNPHSNPSLSPAQNGCRAQLGKRGAWRGALPGTGLLAPQGGGESCVPLVRSCGHVDMVSVD